MLPHLYVNPNAEAQARALGDDDDHERVEAHDDTGDTGDGEHSRPLFGIPVLLKDNIDTADMPTTAGSVALAGSLPPNDAFITRKLRAAGGILLGKGTLTEFANFIALGMPTGYSSLGGFGFNPYDPRPLPGGDGRPVLQTGGSSSGPGISVNANLVTVAVGTETSGSILSPASANGVVGIMNAAIDVLRDKGAEVQFLPEPFPAQLGSCVSYPPPAGCSTVLLYGQKRDLNAYLAATPGAPHHTIAEIVAFNATYNPPLKYGQAIFEAAQQVDTTPSSADTLRYQADRAEDLVRSRGALDAVYNGPDGIRGTADDVDAILASANSFAATPREGGLSEHHRTRRVRTAHPADRESVPLGGDVLRPGLLRAAADRPGLRVRAGDPPSPAAHEHAAAAHGQRLASVGPSLPNPSSPGRKGGGWEKRAGVMRSRGLTERK